MIIAYRDKEVVGLCAFFVRRFSAQADVQERLLVRLYPKQAKPLGTNSTR
jgi:hypothetical protein